MTNKRFETRDGVGKKIWQSVKKNAITFNKPVEVDNKDFYTRTWEANKLSSGAKLTLQQRLIKGLNKDGKKRNASYSLNIVHGKDPSPEIRGTYARKIFDRLIKGEPNIKSNKLNEENSSFFENALKGL